MTQKRFLAAALTAMVVFVTLVLTSFPARAEFIDGNKLYATCTSQNPVNQGDCIGYTTGVFDALYNAAVCPPATVTRGQVMDIVVESLRANPSHRHLSADALIYAALTAVWPCKQKQPGPNRAT